MALTLEQHLELSKYKNVTTVYDPRQAAHTSSSIDEDALFGDKPVTDKFVMVRHKSSDLVVETYENYEDLRARIEANPCTNYRIPLVTKIHRNQLQSSSSYVSRVLNKVTGIDHKMSVMVIDKKDSFRFTISVLLKNKNEDAQSRLENLIEKYFRTPYGLDFRTLNGTNGVKMVSAPFDYHEDIYSSVKNFKNLAKLYRLSQDDYAISVQCSDMMRKMHGPLQVVQFFENTSLWEQIKDKSIEEITDSGYLV